MSSYRGAGGAWDGGPPGAEAEYAIRQPYHPPLPPAQPPPPRVLPTTDPWTGVSYSQYGPPPAYDYQAYGATGYSYQYDSTFYQSPDGHYYKYPDAATSFPSAPANYSYPAPPLSRERSRSPVDSPHYRRKRSYSRSVSPYVKKERAYSRKRESSYEGSRRGRSSSRSKSKRNKYSSSDQSRSRSRSYSRSRNDKRKRKSLSSDSSISHKSYKKLSKVRARSHSMTPPVMGQSTSHSRKSRSPSHRSDTRSLKTKVDKEVLKTKSSKPHSNKETKGKDRKCREVATPPRKRSVSPTTPPKVHKKTDKSDTPPKRYKKSERSVTPPKSYKSKEKTVKRRHKESSVTPPKSYARNRSSSGSKSRSRTPLLHATKVTRSCTPKGRRSRSNSSASSRGSHSPRRRQRRKSVSKNRSKSRSRRRSLSRSKSPRRPQKSKAKKSESPKKRSRSNSRTSRSRSQSGTPSEDERRGQFTVADRKRFWKLHKSRQVEKEKDKTPPREVKPPPGAVENSAAEDVEYGVPPEVEGPNFAELLPTADQVLHQAASTSKSKNVPLPIKNDGSFLEMFKKLQEETKKIEEVEKKPEIKKPLPFIGKRRGGRVLKTGLVKKAKAIDEQTVDNSPKDAWSLYMQEVKKYRETSCEEERKTRPLVK